MIDTSDLFNALSNEDYSSTIKKIEDNQSYMSLNNIIDLYLLTDAPKSSVFKVKMARPTPDDD